MSRSTVLLEAHAAGCPGSHQHSYAFSGLCGEIFATSPAEVAPALAVLEEGVANGLHAAGYMAYEAASGLDPVLATRHGTDQMPLLWFGLYESKAIVEAGVLQPRAGYSVSSWRPSIERPLYERALASIREYIASGDTYQVNFTLSLLADFAGDEVGFFRELCRAQPTPYSAFLDLGRYAILSVSPELFFSLKDGVLTSRPMKGTRHRGRWREEDAAVANELHAAPKDRAENLMILDLVRNDLGRVSATGSVKVSGLWQLERYRTLWQMTSEVKSRLQPGTELGELFTALFPCGSVTGAPKVRTMQIIAELEDRPRGVYTGCIGYVSPDMEACFNVAIRTVVVDREKGVAEYGVGGGVTWDSKSRGEYEEWQLKARVLTNPEPEFTLHEALLLVGNEYFLLDRHLQRLQASAAYFEFSLDLDCLRRDLESLCRDRDSQAREQVHLSLLRSGDYDLEIESIPPAGPPRLPVTLSAEPVDRRNRHLYHQTSLHPRRNRAGDPAGAELILVNGDGEVTECSGGNLVAVIAGRAWTPPVECGLLPGVFRAELLSRGQVEERVLSRQDLAAADQLYRIDSVRQWVPLSLSW